MSDWKQEFLEQADAEREEALKAAGYKPFVKLSQGENRVKIDLSKPPRIIPAEESKFGKERYIFDLLEPEEEALSVNRIFASQIIRYCVTNETNEITIIRVGTGADTRMDIKK